MQCALVGGVVLKVVPCCREVAQQRKWGGAAALLRL
jgi:hypothetical protein